MTYLRFSSDLVPEVVTGRKYLTARYRLDREIEPGDVVSALEEDAVAPFASLRIVANIAIRARHFVDLVDLIGGHRRYSNVDELLDQLGRLYDPPPHGFNANTPLRAVFFQPIGDAEFELSRSKIGNHHVNRIQSSVPTEILEDLGAEPGDELVYRPRSDGAVVVVLREGSA